MAKKVKFQFQLHMMAGKATPAPPIWPALWQYWLNIGQVVKEFNDATRELMWKFWGMDVKVPVNFRVYADRSYDLEILPPLTSHLILWKIKQKKGSGEPNKKKLPGKLTRADLEEIAEIKKPVLNTRKIDSVLKMIAWTAKSLWIEIDDKALNA